MKGTVLSFAQERGVMLGEDGARYHFSADEWRGDAAPRPREDADFVASGTAAIDIFPLGSTAQAPAARLGDAVKARMEAAERALGHEPAGDIMGSVRTVVAERPQVVLNVVLVLAAFALTWLSMGGLLNAQRIETSLVSLPGIIADMRAPLEDSVATMGNYLAEAQGSPYSAPALLATARANLNKATTALWMLRLAPLLYLIPLGAVVALVLEYRGRRSRLLELSTGVLAVVALLALLFGREMLAAAVTNNFGTGGATVRTLVKVGFGGWITAACGVGLVLTAVGALRRTPGL